MKNDPVIKYMLLAAGLVLAILYFSQITQTALGLWQILFPLVLGFTIAYVMNIMVIILEKRYFPKSKSKWLIRSRKPVCLVLAFILIALIVVLVIGLVVPEIINTITAIAAALPTAIESIKQWILERREQWPAIASQIDQMSVDWESLTSNAINYLTKGIGGIVSSSLSVLSVLISGVFNLFMGIAFSIYLLLGKNRLIAQFKRVQAVFVNKEATRRMNAVLNTAHECFSKYIVGQVTEALILGCLCTGGMWIFQFPMATTVGVFVGAMALIPVFGAYIGAGVGAFLIFATSPVKALLFLVFIVVLQQIEGNVIYPKVVGTSIGLPGVFVLAAVIIGGGLGGVVGMLLGVPLTATAYKLIRMEIMKRESLSI